MKVSHSVFSIQMVMIVEQSVWAKDTEREKNNQKTQLKMSEKCKEQSEMPTNNEKRESKWVSKAVPFIVCDISLERFCTAGILSEFLDYFWF